jgi:hypothetical protein
VTHDLATILLAAGLVTMPCIVGQMAAERGVDVGRALETVTLESAWDAAAVGDNGLAVGLWQWHGEGSYDTWAWACELTGHGGWADDANRADAIRSTIVALDMIERGYGWLWTGWGVAG